jgi:Family of unknown function (DUF5662)
MPRKYLIEMVCDWRSFSRKWGKKVKGSHLDLTDKIILHPETRKELRVIMNKVDVKGRENTLSNY